MILCIDHSNSVTIKQLKLEEDSNFYNVKKAIGSAIGISLFITMTTLLIVFFSGHI